jgi:hypothetical protein
MGHGLDDYAKRNGGRKMKIDFSAGRVRPLDPIQAAKLASQCGVYMFAATSCMLLHIGMITANKA